IAVTAAVGIGEDAHRRRAEIGQILPPINRDHRTRRRLRVMPPRLILLPHRPPALSIHRSYTADTIGMSIIARQTAAQNQVPHPSPVTSPRYRTSAESSGHRSAWRA